MRLRPRRLKRGATLTEAGIARQGLVVRSSGVVAPSVDTLGNAVKPADATKIMPSSAMIGPRK
jgi:hypothetical protein